THRPADNVRQRHDRHERRSGHFALKRTTKRLRGDTRVHTRAHEETTVLWFPLQRRHVVEEQLRLRLDRLRVNVLGHTDDVSALRQGIEADPHALADRVLAGPEGRCHRLTDYHDGTRRTTVRTLEGAAAEYARPHRGEVFGRHRIVA